MKTAQKLPYRLMTEELRERFGDIYVDTTFQDASRRIGFLRRSSDRAILTYHVVEFDARGVQELGKFHDEIVQGSPLGETVKRSQIPHERTDTDLQSSVLPEVLAEIFGTDKKQCLTKIVTYTIHGKPYARIQEFLNPRFTPAPEPYFHMQGCTYRRALAV